MVLAGTGTLSVGIAFFGAGVLTILLGSLTLREAYETIEWPILVMLGALIPVSEAIRTTGGTDVIAQLLSTLAHTLPGWGAVALMLLAAMMITPFLNNAATVLVMGPGGYRFGDYSRLGAPLSLLILLLGVPLIMIVWPLS
jgi:di/tricarboxylate transporter